MNIPGPLTTIAIVILLTIILTLLKFRKHPKRLRMHYYTARCILGLHDWRKTIYYLLGKKHPSKECFECGKEIKPKALDSTVNRAVFGLAGITGEDENMLTLAKTYICPKCDHETPQTKKRCPKCHTKLKKW